MTLDLAAIKSALASINPRVVNVRTHHRSYIYVGRAMSRIKGSVFGNPFRFPRKNATEFREFDTFQPLSAYHTLLDGQVTAAMDLLCAGPFVVTSPLFFEIGDKLRKRSTAMQLAIPGLILQLAEHRLPLGCWCAPDPCHADVLWDYVDWWLDQPGALKSLQSEAHRTNAK